MRVKDQNAALFTNLRKQKRKLKWFAVRNMDKCKGQKILKEDISMA